MKNAILIFLFGGIGSVFRYGLGYIVNLKFSFMNLPLGTIVVNIIGCFVIGLLVEMFKIKNQFNSDLELILTVGLLGGFTTFSALELQRFEMIEDKMLLNALLNIVISIILGIFAVWLGKLLAKFVF